MQSWGAILDGNPVHTEINRGSFVIITKTIQNTQDYTNSR